MNPSAAEPVPTTDPTIGMALSISRTSFAAGLGFLAGKGYLATDQIAQLLPYAGVIGTAAFGAYSHWKGRQDVKVALALPATAT